MHHTASHSFQLWFVGKWWEHFNYSILTRKRALVGRTTHLRNILRVGIPWHNSCTTCDPHQWDSNSLRHLKRGCCRSITTSDLPWTAHPVYTWGNAKRMGEGEWLWAEGILPAVSNFSTSAKNLKMLSPRDIVACNSGTAQIHVSSSYLS